MNEKKCLICGKEHNNKKYCSEKCQYESYKKQRVERIILNCLFCGKEFSTTKNRKIKYNNQYCSRKCVDLHKKETYIGENNPMYGKEVSDEIKNKHSESATKMWLNSEIRDKIKNGILLYKENNENPPGWDSESKKKREDTLLRKFGVKHIWSSKEIRKNIEEKIYKKYGKSSLELMNESCDNRPTKIERIVECFLIEKCIEYLKQYKIYFNDNHQKKFKKYDFYLPNFDLVIEVDGDYWHGNPKIYNDLNHTQILNIKNDLFKDNLIELNNLNIIRIWETDIFNESYKEKIIEVTYGKDKN